MHFPAMINNNYVSSGIQSIYKQIHLNDIYAEWLKL